MLYRNPRPGSQQSAVERKNLEQEEAHMGDWGWGGLLMASWEEMKENGGRREEKTGIDRASTLTVSIRVEWVSRV